MSGTVATNESVVGTDKPLNVAVIVADWFELMVPTLTVKVAELAPAGMFTTVGTVNWEEGLLARATTVLVVADFDKVTVQVVLALEASVVVPH